MKVMWLIGLSLSFCIRDILRGLIEPHEVLAIFCKADINNPEVFRVYMETYWRGHNPHEVQALLDTMRPKVIRVEEPDLMIPYGIWVDATFQHKWDKRVDGTHQVMSLEGIYLKEATPDKADRTWRLGCAPERVATWNGIPDTGRYSHCKPSLSRPLPLPEGVLSRGKLPTYGDLPAKLTSAGDLRATTFIVDAEPEEVARMLRLQHFKLTFDAIKPRPASNEIATAVFQATHSTLDARGIWFKLSIVPHGAAGYRTLVETIHPAAMDIDVFRTKVWGDLWHDET